MNDRTRFQEKDDEDDSNDDKKNHILWNKQEREVFLLP